MSKLYVIKTTNNSSKGILNTTKITRTISKGANYLSLRQLVPAQGEKICVIKTNITTSNEQRMCYYDK